MQHKLFVIAAVASLSFTTAAFAEGEGDPFPLRLTQQTVTVTNPPRDTGSQGYPAPLHTLANTSTTALLPTTGNGGVESVNARPSNFAVGTEPYVAAETLARWQSQQQSQEGFAAAPATPQPNGG